MYSKCDLRRYSFFMNVSLMQFEEKREFSKYYVPN